MGERFQLTEDERYVLGRGVVDLDRRGRRLYHQRIEPRLDEFRAYMRVLFERERQSGGPDVARAWATAVGLDVVAKGYASVCDLLVMDIVGRKRVSDVVKAMRGGAFF